MHMIMEELEGTTNVKHGEVLIESSRWARPAAQSGTPPQGWRSGTKPKLSLFSLARWSVSNTARRLLDYYITLSTTNSGSCTIESLRIKADIPADASWVFYFTVIGNRIANLKSSKRHKSIDNCSETIVGLMPRRNSEGLDNMLWTGSYCRNEAASVHFPIFNWGLPQSKCFGRLLL